MNIYNYLIINKKKIIKENKISFINIWILIYLIQINKILNNININ